MALHPQVVCALTCIVMLAPLHLGCGGGEGPSPQGHSDASDAVVRAEGDVVNGRDTNDGEVEVEAAAL